MKNNTALKAAHNSYKLVPLSDLSISTKNIRKSKPSEQSIEELAATIVAQSLLNPLFVEQVTGSETLYGVIAGGRRLRALQLLASEGKLPTDYPVKCHLVGSADAVEVSLIENMTQEAMHPADEFEAYQTLAKEGKPVELIAAKFGVSVAHVSRRLKLANVAPELLDLYKANEMTLDQVMALASVDDQERQVNTWNGLSPYNRQAHNIKSKLTEDEVSANDKRVNLVGLETYVVAGGDTRTDLFAEGDNRMLTDVGLLEMLVSERLEVEAETLRGEGWLWVETLPAFGYEERQQYEFPVKKYLAETPDIEAKRLSLEAESAALQEKVDAAYESDDDEMDTINAMEEQIEAIDGRIDALKESRLDTSGHDKTKSGVIVTFDVNGLVLMHGMVRKVDRKSSERQNKNNEGETRSDVPEKMMLNLSSHRSAAMQAMMISNPHISLAALATKMAFSIFEHREESPVKISLNQSAYILEKNAPTLSTSRAANTLVEERSAWKEKLPENGEEWFAWFMKQPQEVAIGFIVFSTASCTQSLQCRTTSFDDAKPIADALKLDMADWWEPTPENYLDALPKKKLIEIAEEVAGTSKAEELLKLKKPEVVEHVNLCLQGNRWLPTPLRNK